MIEWLTSHAKDLVEIGLQILGAASLIARITPTEVDNRVLAKLTSVIHLLGLTKK